MAGHVPEHDHLEGEGDEDVKGVLHQADHVGLLQLEGEDVDHLLGKAKKGQAKDAKAFTRVAWKTEELEVGADHHQLQDVEDLGGDGQGGPVHVPEVADDGGGGGGKALGGEEAEGGVEHVAAVLGGCGAEDKGRLDDEEDSDNDEHKVEDLKQAARLVEQNAGEEGDDDGLDRGDHGHVGNGKVAHLSCESEN